ncbi:MAG: ATP-binding protein [Candidatus Saganbacteria bacterium]|nr:ATP-binding protein [Candidatus Saganbacteria bacterium]
MSIFSLPPVVSACFFLVLGFFVLSNNYDSKVNRTFFLMCLSTFIWQFTWTVLFSMPTTRWVDVLVRTGYTGIIFIPITFFHFVANFSQSSKDKMLLLFAYLCGLFFLLTTWFTDFFIQGYYQYFWGSYPKAGILHPFYLALLLVLSIRGIWILIELTSKKSSTIQKTQVRYVLIALLFYIPAASDFIVNYGFEFYPLGFIFIIISSLIIAYATLKHHLMDIDIILRKSIIYSLLIAIVMGVYGAVVFGLQTAFQGVWGGSPWLSSLIVAILIAIGYRPLENLITNTTDRFFFKKKYDYQKALREISSAMAHLTNVNRLVDLTTKIVVRTMRLEGASSLILDEKKKRFELRAAVRNAKELLGMTVSDNHLFIQEIKKTGQPLIREEIEHIINVGGAPDEELSKLIQMKEELVRLKTAVAVPTFSKGKGEEKRLIGVMCLGEKLSEDMFGDEDINLLSTLSNQASIALENAMLYDQQLRSRDALIKQEKMAALGTMAAGIVHELKNPLAFISTVAQLMPLRWDDPEFRATTQKMLPEEAKRMQKIVESLLEYSRQKELHLEPVDLTSLIDNVITMLAFETRKHGVTIIKDFKQNPTINGDHHRLMQVFVNLINNAVQAMPRGGTVRVFWEDKGNQVAIHVADTGIGIPRESMATIFNPFYTTKEGGTGLGLSITQKIVEEHNGSILVESEVGKGTMFTILLPVAA